MKIPHKLSDRVVVVGIDPRGKGGIATVITQQSAMMESLNFIKVATSGWKKYLLPFTAIFKSLKFIGRKYRVAHIHACSGSDFYRSSIFIYLYKIMGKTVIMHMHGSKFEEFYALHPSFVKRVAGKCDMIVTVSNYFVNFFKNNDIHQRVRLLHNSIEPHNSCSICTKSDKLIFSYFGALDDRKGIFDCLEAIGRNVSEFRGKIELHLAGNGDIDRMNKLVSQYELDDIVFYHGWIDRNGKHELLCKTDVFLHPSHFESFGISILEAMDYGLPVITTSVGGIIDLVTNNINGITVEPGNIDEIASAIKSLMSDNKLRKRLGIESANRAKNFYTDKIANKLGEIYSELIWGQLQKDVFDVD